MAVLQDPQESPRSWQEAEAAARNLGRKLLSLEIRDAGEIEGAFKRATAERAAALLVFASGIPDRHARRIARLAGSIPLPSQFPLN